MVDYEDSREEKPESSQLQNSLQKELEKKLGGKRSPGKRSSKSPASHRPSRNRSILKESLSGLLGQVTIRDVTAFCEELALLLEAGLAVVPALRTLGHRSENHKMRRMIQDMADVIEGGGSFTEAAAKYSNVFGPLFVNIFKAGEKSGTLITAIRRVANKGEQMLQVRHRLVSVLLYPAIVVLVAIGVICFAFSYTMTAIKPVLASIGGEIPFAMQSLLSAGAVIRSGAFWVWVAVVLCGLFAGYFIACQFMAFRLLRDRFVVRCPFIRYFVKQNLAANFSRVFATLLHAGIPLPEALEATRGTVKNELLRLTISRTIEAVREGGRLGPGLEKGNVFPALAYDMIEVGEETGELDHVFERMADIYENKAASDLELLGKLVQPAIIIVLAIIVGYIVFAMFQMYSSLLIQITGV
jgi:type IV pilus assembly protein PilC